MNTLGYVRVFDEGQDAGAMLHRTRLAGDLAAARADILAGLVDISHFQGDVAIAGAQLILVHAPVIGQLDDAVVVLVTVADEGQGELAVRVILAAQQGHAQDFGIEGDGFIHVADAQHGMQQSHRFFPHQVPGVRAHKHKPRLVAGVCLSRETPAYQNSLRPLFAAIRMRSALSLMKPAASAWL